MPAKWRLGQVAQDMPETDDSATDFVLQGGRLADVAERTPVTLAIKGGVPIQTTLG